MAGTQLSVSMVQSQLPTDSSKILKFPGPFPGWRFIITIVIIISFARERKTAANVYALNKEIRIVQSPTKLNDKI